VLTANRLKQSTGGIDPKPRVDVCIRTNRRLLQGHRLTLEQDHSIAGVIPQILPAEKMTAESPVPSYMAAEHRLKHTVEKGRLLTYGMIEHDPQSCLWQLRREQDEFFLG
jgi:predicted homoserine dehydrogenase-like protein